MANNKIVINVEIDSNNSEDAIRRLRDELGDIGDGAGQSEGKVNSLGGALKKLGLILTAVFAVDKVIEFGTAIVQSAASAQALQSQFEQVFGNMQGDATAMMEKMGADFGMLPSRLTAPLTQMTSMFKGLGMDTETAMKTAGDAVTLVADAAAFYDMSFENANAALNSFIKGNYEGGEAIGLFANETQLSAWAAKELGVDWKKLDEAGKQVARLQFAQAMQEAAGATGQASRESDGLENQLGNLKQAWEDLKALLGGPILEPVIWAIKTLVGLLQGFDTTPITVGMEAIKTAVTNAFTAVQQFIVDFISQNQEQLSAIAEVFTTAFEAVKTTIQTALDTIKQFWEEHGTTVMETVNNALTGVLDVIQSVLGVVVPFIQENLAKVKQFWDENGTQILAAVKTAFEGIKAVIDFVMPAVKFVIETIWGAIKQLITGALDVIMGAVKIFSGLFTGDFSKMWEGIKQLFFGAIDVILGWMTLSFFGGIKTLLTNFAKSGISIIKGLWDDIVKTFKDMGTKANGIVNGMVKAVINFFKGMYNDAARIFGTLKTFGANTWEALKTAVVTAVKNMVSNVKTQFTSKLTAIKTVMSDVKGSIQKIWGEIISWIKGKVSSFVQIGKDLVSGLIKGISEMSSKAIEAVTGVVDGVINKAKKLLGIASPSKVFKQIGLWTGEGMAIGIDGSSKAVNQSMSKIADGIMSVTKTYQKEYKQLLDAHNKSIEDKEDATQKKIQSIRSKAAKKKRSLTTAELNEIKKLEADYKNYKITSEQEFQKKYAAMVEKSEKDYLAVITQTIADKKSLGQLSLIDEAKIWEQSIELFKEGSAERIKAQQEHNKAVEAVAKEVETVNTAHMNQITKINEELAKQEETLTKAYQDAVDKRAESLVSFKNLFDEFKAEIDVTGEELLNNLGSQVDGFKRWQQEIELLSMKAIDEGLLAELRAMGPNALPELIALNTLTAEQLTQYSKLYKEKSELARTQAESELIGMKKDTEKQIKDLRSTANKELDVVKKDWVKKIKEITTGTNNELMTLEQVGKNAGQGLLDGLSSMEPSLQRKAQSIADTIKRTIESALDINSPSKWMRDHIMGSVAEGWEDGVDKNMGAIEKATEKMSGFMMPDIDDVLNSAKALAKTTINGIAPVSTAKANSNVNGKTGSTFSAKINNYFTPKESTPYESAKKQRQEMQRLGIEWGLQ